MVVLYNIDYREMFKFIFVHFYKKINFARSKGHIKNEVYSFKHFLNITEHFL